MKRLAILFLTVLLAGAVLTACATNKSDSNETTSSTEATATPTPTPKPSDIAAFEGSADEILEQLINKTIEAKVVVDEELKGIKCYHNPVDAESCQDILGLTPDEFAADVEAAVESKPESSWFAHSIVVIKGKKGIDMAVLADQIAKGTNPARFGCIKAEAVVVGYAGQYVFLCASFKNTCDAVYSTFSSLSAVTAVRIDRENDWNDGGLLG